VLRVLVSVVVLAGLEYYVWRRVVRDTGLTGAARGGVSAAVIALPLPMMVVALSSRGGPPAAHGWLAWVAFLGWAMFGLTLVGLLVVDLGRAAVWAVRKAARRGAPIDPSRRQAIARITGGLVTTVVAGEVAVGMRSALGRREVVDVPVTLDRLPAAFDGFTIAQITDVHVGGTIGRRFVEDLVRQTNAVGADAIAITGDIVDGSVAELRDAVAPLGDLRAPHGVYFVTGNHEYYSGADAWIAHMRELGIRVLRNERVEIVRAGAAFDLAGIDDHSAAQFERGHGADLDAALAGRDPDRVVVLLAHQPRQARIAARFGVDLQISGHTHGGQVWPWHYLASLQQGGLIAGRYRLGRTQLYVSRGAGYWGPPIRVGAPAELTRIVLRSGWSENADLG
jgi:uncharacterized protein